MFSVKNNNPCKTNVIQTGILRFSIFYSGGKKSNNRQIKSIP